MSVSSSPVSSAQRSPLSSVRDVHTTTTRRFLSAIEADKEQSSPRVPLAKTSLRSPTEGCATNLNNLKERIAQRLEHTQIKIKDMNKQLLTHEVVRPLWLSRYSVEQHHVDEDFPKKSDKYQLSWLKGEVKFKSFHQEVIEKITIYNIAKNKINNKYFASDVILSLLGRAFNKRIGEAKEIITADDLPGKFPEKLSFDKVIEPDTLKFLGPYLWDNHKLSFLNDDDDWSLTITNESHPELFVNILTKTPIGKAANNAVNDFNTLKKDFNTLKEKDAATISSIKLRHSKAETALQNLMTNISFYIDNKE